MAGSAPDRFGKCRVVKLLGQGATAYVFLAKHEVLDMPVAVKVLRKGLSDRKPQYAERFLREAKMAAWLDHPNIVRVIDCGIEEGYHYMVMDYVDGPNCLEKLQDHPEGLDWHEATEVALQVAGALAYAVTRDVIHRDVKPSNIMIDSTGRVRVTDLGLAKLTIKGMASLTQELHTVGTPNYMSPEQIKSSDELDLRTDIYSLGASLYHMVCGTPPYGGKTAMRVPPLVPGYCLSICSADFNEWVVKNVTVDWPYSYMFTGEYEMFEFNLGHTFSYAEMAALIAPRPFMVERGHRDGVAPDEWVAYEYAKVRRLYTRLGIRQRTEIEFFDGPHEIHGVGTFRFLHKHLNWPEEPPARP